MDAVDWFARSGEVREAAQVAYLFKLDPVQHLRSSWVERQIRAAAASYILEQLDGHVTPDQLDPTM